MTTPTLPVLAGRTVPEMRSVNWATDVPQAVGGLTTAISYQADETYHWEVPYSVLRAFGSFTEFRKMVGFINSLRGRQGVFYFDDAADDAVTDENFGTGDATTRKFQLQRAFDGTKTSVQSPNVITNIKINGSVSTAYVLEAGGIIDFNSAPASSAALTWTGSYYWLCRLDDDKTEFPMFYPKWYELKALKFTQVLL